MAPRRLILAAYVLASIGAGPLGGGWNGPT